MIKEQQVLNKYNEVAKEKAATYEECFAQLNVFFKEKYEEEGDAQLAYDALANEYPFIHEYFAYMMLGFDIEVVSTEFERDMIESFNNYYDDDCETLNDVAFKLKSQVYKAMSNAGCDVLTAFESISEDINLEGLECIVDGFELCWQ